MDTAALLREAFDAVHTEILEHEDGCPPDCGDIPHLYNARTALQVLIDRLAALAAAGDALAEAVEPWLDDKTRTAVDGWREARREVEA
jgi:hypothetical protein